MTSSPGTGVMNASKVFAKSIITNPSRVAIVAVFSIVLVVAYWKNMDEGRRPAPALSTLLFTAESHPGAELPMQSSVQSTLQPPVRKLVDALRREVLKVQRNTGVSADTGFDLEKWRQENPCLSRTELPTYYSRLSNSPSRKVLGIAETSQWETVLYEYARLHRVCIRAAGNLTEYFGSRNTSTGCKFFIGYAANGLGNKFFIMVPSVLYAILTHRVVLLPESTGVPDLVCEPFPGSTWRVSDGILQSDSNQIWNQSNEFMDNVDRAKREHDSVLPIYASRIDDNWLPIGRFFCEVEQSYFRKVTWLAGYGCLYWLPKLYSIPSFQTTLEALFSDASVALTHILRTAFLPRDITWARVKGAEYLFNASDVSRSQIGIQARYFNSSEAKHKVINANVESCLVENNILEEAIPTRKTSLRHETTIFVASLTSDLQEHLHDVYDRSTASEYTMVNFLQLSSEKEQRSGLQVYEQVLVEVLWLSFSNTLLVSAASTFGGLAQGYGALTPWLIEKRDNEKKPCQRGQTSDGCLQTGDHNYRCPYSEKNGQPLTKSIPYIKPCLQIDAMGIQLVNVLRNTSEIAAR